jgi:uncharacterized coiled-coil DUF342 family protein
METLCQQILSLNGEIQNYSQKVKSLKDQRKECEMKLDHLMIQQGISSINVDNVHFILKETMKKEPLTLNEKINQIKGKLEEYNVNLDSSSVSNLLKFETNVLPSSKIVIKK